MDNERGLEESVLWTRLTHLYLVLRTWPPQYILDSIHDEIGS